MCYKIARTITHKVLVLVAVCQTDTGSSYPGYSEKKFYIYIITYIILIIFFITYFLLLRTSTGTSTTGSTSTCTKKSSKKKTTELDNNWSSFFNF